MVISFGPNHPAAHGILRLNFNLQGEILQKVDPQFGFLHRGTEKLAEQRSWLQNVPYFDRFDYVANLFQEHAYCQAVEQLTFQPTTSSAVSSVFLARVIFDELSRLMNHLLTLGAVCLDVGAMGPIFWAFEERERLMEFYERASGARMHTALYKPNEFDWSPLTTAFCTDLSRFTFRCGRSINGAVMGLANNKILKTRLSGVGSLSPVKLANYSITGVIARSAGLRTDLRKLGSSTYRCYQTLTFKSFLGTRGDNLDRFLIRVKESFETFHLVGQALATLVSGSSGSAATRHEHHTQHTPKPLNWTSLHPTVSSGTKFSSMEALINHFKGFSGGIRCIRGVVYGAVESPKGEMGVTLVSTGGQYPYRLKVRSPVSHNMHLLVLIAQGVLMGDFVMIFCSLDVVLGEIDR
jgi:NADH-quinone oxidoreductase subunit D